MMKKIFLFLFFTCTISLFAKEKIRVACVGNSVTFGYLLPDREVNAYPFQLQRMLGIDYEVGNFGKSGATLLNHGHRPYMQQEEFRAAMNFAADRVIIHLGLNDTDPRDWPNYRDEFITDYRALIDSFRSVNPKCKIWICRLSPITHLHKRFRSGTRDWYGQIQQAIENIATYANVGLIDFEEGLFNRPDLLPDALHPNVEGAGILAKTVYSTLTGNYGGLQMPMVYSDNMVLQRDIPLNISGIADAGGKVTIEINGQRQTTKAGENGKWSITLSPLKAGGPYTLAIRAKSKSLLYKNVLVGEVWICSGQSNMAFMLKQAVTAKEDIAGAKNSNIRLFDMKPRWETNAVEWDASVLDSLSRLQYYKETVWKECTPENAASFSAIGYHFGKMLADSLGVPVGLINNAVGGSPCESWIDRRTLQYELPDMLEDYTNNDMIQDWVRGRAALNVKQAKNKLQRHPYEPCYLFESGILPLAKYPIKGVVWYQGESNAHNMELYEKLFPMMVNSWRKNWNNSSLPFIYVQLSSLNRPSWPWFRDAQRRLMDSIPNTCMVVSSDKGDSLDVHPRMKKEIGERAGRWTLNRVYSMGNVTPSGPLFRSVSFKESVAYITFDYAHGLSSSDKKPLRTFEIAGADKVYYPAKAEIVGDMVKIWSDKVEKPESVRYGWQPFTRANLVNSDGLPASTFQSK